MLRAPLGLGGRQEAREDDVETVALCSLGDNALTRGDGFALHALAEPG
jgi:hypothetical protein